MTQSKVSKLIAVAALALSGSAFAQTVTQNVNVSVTFTPTCRIATGTAATLTVAFPAYTAFQTLAITPTTSPSFTIECSRNYGNATPTVAWDTANGTSTGGGTVAGLAYSLTTASPVITNGAAATGATGATARTVVYTIGGSIAGNQPGDSTAGSPSATRTMTVTY
jgi:hypothetical protein